MKIITKHIGVTVISATLLVLLILIGLQTFISFVAQLNDLGKGHYGLWQAMIYVPLTLPSSVYAFFPMAGLLGSLLGLGYLASNSELIIMRTSGVSMLRIVWAVLCAALVMLFFMTIIGELVSPFSMHYAKTEKAIAKSGGQALNTKTGIWMRDGDNFIHIDSAIPGLSLNGISQYQFNNDHQLLKTVYAKTAIRKNHQWLLQNIVETKFKGYSAKSDVVTQRPWSVKVNPELMQISEIDPAEMSLHKLSQVIHYRKANGLTVRSYQLEFWQRVLQPLSTLVMIFLAIPFIFGPLRSVPMGLRIVTGVVVGFSFYLLNQFLGPFSLVYQIPPFVGAVLPSLLFISLGFILMRHARS